MIFNSKQFVDKCGIWWYQTDSYERKQLSDSICIFYLHPLWQRLYDHLSVIRWRYR